MTEASRGGKSRPSTRCSLNGGDGVVRPAGPLASWDDVCARQEEEEGEVGERRRREEARWRARSSRAEVDCCILFPAINMQHRAVQSGSDPSPY